MAHKLPDILDLEGIAIRKSDMPLFEKAVTPLGGVVGIRVFQVSDKMLPQGCFLPILKRPFTKIDITIKEPPAPEKGGNDGT